MSIILNQDNVGLWNYVVISPDGGYLCTSKHIYDSPEIAASHARMWIDNPHN